MKEPSQNSKKKFNIEIKWMGPETSRQFATLYFKPQINFKA